MANIQPQDFPQKPTLDSSDILLGQTLSGSVFSAKVSDTGLLNAISESVALRAEVDDHEVRISNSEIEIDNLNQYILQNRLNINTVIASYDLTSSDDAVFADIPDGTEIVITLPEAADFDGKRYYVKFIAGIGSRLKIDSSGGYIDGLQEVFLHQINEALTLISDGNNWHIF